MFKWSEQYRANAYIKNCKPECKVSNNMLCCVVWKIQPVRIGLTEIDPELPKIDRPYSCLITHSTGPIQKIQRIWRHRNEVLLLVLSQIITSSLNFWMIETGTVTFMNQTPASPKSAQAHQNAPIHTPENERLGRNCSPKNLFFGFDSECIWKCFSGWHPVLFLFITLNSPKLHDLCSLETDSKSKKQEAPGNLVYLASKHEGHNEG